MNRSRLKPVLGAIAVVALAAGALGGASSASTTARSAASCPYKFAVITHGDNGSFWSVVYKGAKNAASDLGCKLTEVYGSQQQGQAEPDDNAENAQIQNAINAKVNGIAVSDHDPEPDEPDDRRRRPRASRWCCSTPAVTTRTSPRASAMTCVGQPETARRPAGGGRGSRSGSSRTSCASSTSRDRTCSTAATASRRPRRRLAVQDGSAPRRARRAPS